MKKNYKLLLDVMLSHFIHCLLGDYEEWWNMHVPQTNTQSALKLFCC